jgi:MrcB-like, N-terminal domain/Domain of unknown function (DUF3883)
LFECWWKDAQEMNNLTLTIRNIRSGWPDYRSRKTTNAESKIHKLIVKEFPSVLESWSSDSKKYKFQGSDGQGNILAAPWVAVFNRDITESASQGYYLVYLFSEDLKSLVLEIGFGATQFVKRYGSGKALYGALNSAVNNMRINSSHLASINLQDTFQRTNADEILLTHTGDRRLKTYEKCAIYSLKYNLENLPTDDILKKDYSEYLKLYDTMSESLLLAEVDDYVLETIKVPDTQVKLLDFELRPPSRIKNKSSEANQNRAAYRRSKRSDKIGKLGEEYVHKFEVNKLKEAGFLSLASKVIWHREDTLNRTPGWDITSYDFEGNPKYIEVKSTEGDSINEILLTKNEVAKLNQLDLAENYYIYLVTDITGNPGIEVLKNPSEYLSKGELSLQVETYSMSLRESKAK